MISNQENCGKKGQRRKTLYLQHIALFISLLVIALPIYSSNALAASISITQNTGTDGYDGFIDAQGDTWSVEAQITGHDGNVVPDQVLLDVGTSETAFSSCSGNTCTFLSPLDGGIAEGSYEFSVVLYEAQEGSDAASVELGSELASDAAIVRADGSAPDITFSTVEQQPGGVVYLDFDITDEPAECIGLASVDIIDSDSGIILQSLSVPNGECSFDYVTDGGTSGILPLSLDGEGKRYIKIRATDLLGHTATSSAKQFDTDFVVPFANSDSLEIEGFGEYIGTSTQSTRVSVDVTECADLERVTATSAQIDFFSEEATCIPLDLEVCTFECYWSNVPVTPSGNAISAIISMEDGEGNIGENTVSTTFVADTTPPVVVSYGTEFVYEEKSYVAAGEETTIYATIEEEGSGITVDTVAANLDAISVGGDDFTPPDECEQSTTNVAQYECEWTVTVPSLANTETREINLRLLEDGVGNSGTLLAKNIVVDALAPVVKDIEFHGYSAIGEKDYFQSNDDLVIDLAIAEGSGLVIWVDADDIVMDAENIYQYGEIVDDEYVASDMDGWAKFESDESCVRNEETFEWACQVRVNSIKSGHDSDATVKVDVRDTAGNSAEVWPDGETGTEPQNAQGTEGEYFIEIFALDEETQPDFWEIDGTPYSVGDTFVDVEVAPLTYTRIYMAVGLNAPGDVRLSRAELQQCTPVGDGPAINRALLYGSPFSGPIANPDLNVVLEFAPFESSSLVGSGEDLEGTNGAVDKEYTCTINIYSIVDDVAMNYAESQEVVLSVPFGFSELGAADENVDQMIIDSVNNGWFKFLDVIGKINSVLKWVNYAGRGFNILMSLIQVIQTIAAIDDGSLRLVPVTGNSAAGAKCLVQEGATEPIPAILKGLTVVFDVISCNPNNALPEGATAGMSWYYNYQKSILSWWKFAKGEWLIGAIGGYGPETFTNPGAERGAIHSDQAGSVRSQETRNDGYFSSQTADLVGSTTTEAASLYDNIIVSTVGLCLPGVVHNLEKLRQIECTHIKCLQEGVATGLTTLDVCQKTKAYLTCKYFLGEVMGLLPFDIVEYFVDLVKNILLDPISLIMVAVKIGCKAACPGSGTATKFCNDIGYVFRLIEVVSNVVSMVVGFKSVQYDVCKEIGVQEILDQVSADEEAQENSGSVTTADLASESGSEEAAA